MDTTSVVSTAKKVYSIRIGLSGVVYVAKLIFPIIYFQDMYKISKIILSASIPLCAGFIGSIFTSPNIPIWYARLHKPLFNPPNWIFGPVWTTLFILMGVAFYLIWNLKRSKQRDRAMMVFGLQLILNVLWSILFFGMQNPLYAFVEIIILWVTIFSLMIMFYRLNKTAGVLIVPYILWVSFAAVLNGSIYFLNR